MKLDILAFAAHPDDIELSCSGTLYKHIQQGAKVGIIDMTQGELGTRGSGPLRLIEAEYAGKVLGIHARENLGMDDGFFEDNKENQIKIIEMIRKYQPDLVLANTLEDRHPDHGKAGKLVAKACFFSGLRKIETQLDGIDQEAWRPNNLLHYIQDYYHQPDIIVDITPYMEVKLASVKAFKSQFYDPNSDEPNSPISGKEFFDFLKGRAMQFGRLIKTEYGEGFNTSRPVGVENLNTLI